MNKPNKCCGLGTYQHQVPIPIKGRRVDIDFCIVDLVAALNAAGIETIASCCGHGGEAAPIISLADGRHLTIMDNADDVAAAHHILLNRKMRKRRNETTSRY